MAGATSRTETSGRPDGGGRGAGRVVDGQDPLGDVVGGGAGAVLDLHRLQAQGGDRPGLAADRHHVRPVVQVGLAELEGEEAVGGLLEVEGLPAHPDRPQGVGERLHVLVLDDQVEVGQHRRPPLPHVLAGQAHGLQEPVRVGEVHLGLQGLGHGRPLPHAGGDPQLGAGVGVHLGGQALDHVRGPAGGPQDLVAEGLDPLLVQPEPLVVAGAVGRPVAVHGAGHVVGEEGAELGPGPPQLAGEDVEQEHRLVGPAAVAHRRPAPLGQQLPGQGDVGRRADPEPAAVPDHRQGVLPRDVGVDVAGRLPRHGQVEPLELDQLRRVGHRLGGERVGQVEGVGAQVVGDRVAVQGGADGRADPGVVQQRPHRREPLVGLAPVLPEAGDHVLLVVDPAVQRGPGRPRRQVPPVGRHRGEAVGAGQDPGQPRAGPGGDVVVEDLPGDLVQLEQHNGPSHPANPTRW